MATVTSFLLPPPRRILPISGLLPLLAMGCTAETHDVDLSEIPAGYADLVLASYEDSLALAVELQAALHAFVDSPSETTLQAAKQAWLDSREPYLQTEAYRFYGGPIDDEDGPEGLINSWPMNEAYVDYVVDDPEAGIINHPEEHPDLSAEILQSLNQPTGVEGGEEAVATGYHAIEFLLWGQDLNAEGPGNRPYTDYVTDGSGTASNPERRGIYLTTVGDLLVAHLTSLVEEWTAGGGSYQETFLALTPEEAVGLLMTGMGSLSGVELAGERLRVAYETQLQEDEHSCFSDNTHRDVVGDVKGLINVYRGSYLRLDGTTVSGPSLSEVVTHWDSSLGDRLNAELEATLADAEAIQAPFDQEISGDNPEGRERVSAVIDDLDVVTASLVDAATLLGLTLNVQ